MSLEESQPLSVLLAQFGAGRQRFRHFIYIPDQAKAATLAVKLRLDGFDVECRRGAGGIDWLVLACHLMIPDEGAVERLSDHLTALAEAMDGEYDGWEAGPECQRS